MENQYLKEAIHLLKTLISKPSISQQENETAVVIQKYLNRENVLVFRHKNNVWAKYTFFDASKPTLLLNSHHDTVMPTKSWTLPPLHAREKDGKIYGLGSNDAGGALVALIQTFLHFSNCTDLQFNIIFAASAEEEISGKNGMESLLPELGKIDVAIVGEPTQMQMAVAEKGLMVLDCTAEGKAGHAARNEGENAIYKAMDSIVWFRNYSFPDISPVLGSVKMSVTQIEAGQKHNIVPDVCKFVVDIRTTEKYSNEQVLEMVKQNVNCRVEARSTRLNSSFIDLQHPLVVRGKQVGLSMYGSPTLSDMALMPFQSIKIGPGASERSHTADEFIYSDEISEGIKIYISLLEHLEI